MFSKEKRLSREEFSNLFKTGKRIHSDAFTLIYSPSEAPKASVVVSKKIAGGIIERNLLRRRLYAVLREDLPYTSILIAKKPAKTTSFKDLVVEYKSLLQKIK